MKLLNGSNLPMAHHLELRRNNYEILKKIVSYKVMAQKEIDNFLSNKIKVKILNSGEGWVSIKREVTEEQYKLLLSIAEELDAKAIPYAPSLEIEKIE